MILLDRAVGIDLGTTHSEIALLAPSEREVVLYQDRFGRSTGLGFVIHRNCATGNG